MEMEILVLLSFMHDVITLSSIPVLPYISTYISTIEPLSEKTRYEQLR